MSNNTAAANQTTALGYANKSDQLKILKLGFAGTVLSLGVLTLCYFLLAGAFPPITDMGERLAFAARWVCVPVVVLQLGVSMTGGKERWLSMRRDRYKLIQTCMPEIRQELFDLVADPGEANDLSQQLPQESRALYRDLGAIMGGEPCPVMRAAVRGKAPTVGLSEESVEALRALGYLGE